MQVSCGSVPYCQFNSLFMIGSMNGCDAMLLGLCMNSAFRLLPINTLLKPLASHARP
jgi:hypothetical protein